MDADLNRLGYDDGKDPGAMRTIGEVARALGIRQHVLRYWEEQFAMLKPVKRSGGRRYYRPEDVAMIVRIDRLVHKEGYTLRGARQALEAAAAEAGAEVVAEPVAVAAATPAILPAIGDPRGVPGWSSRLTAIRNQLAEALSES